MGRGARPDATAGLFGGALGSDLSSLVSGKSRLVYIGYWYDATQQRAGGVKGVCLVSGIWYLVYCTGPIAYPSLGRLSNNMPEGFRG